MTLFKSTENNTPDINSDQENDVLAQVTQKFRTTEGALDVEALARGKIEADRHISKVEADNADLRKELASRLSVEEFMDQMNSPLASNTPQPQADERSKTREVAQPSTPDLKTLVRQTLQEESNAQKARSNVDQVQSELVKNWGSDYVGKLKARATELSMSEGDLNSLAQRSPKAFLELVGIRGTPENTNVYSPPRSSVTMARTTNANPRNFKYWNDLRKKDPTSYFSVEMTNRRHADAEEHGGDFTSNFHRFNPNREH